ncbi:MAG: winged helix-turn-helix transcriptional regulator [Mesorhizobium sp.]|uniref:Lrp/AsnC family transcriptional regulator n=1 Tax=unclassified Mesorhizobium TaxID=325217 RepID=UPI000FCADF09|nr:MULTISPECIES: Lrp/AsnC family transcriptional regulator [unclassified Mesorhizobium]RUW83320.1 Lrp/AsnC family transcriptional regulator [Mesorhizobium sp. M1E.F.Ca.ET.063.01.1.1]TIW08908.1 MAG: winged helix-turn-helix transcriptional regulator [Mesorhizobium sp.]
MQNRQRAASMKLDKIDIKILQAIQKNGRITKAKLSELVGLSVSPCFERLRRLERAGIVRRYLADIDIDRLFKSILMVVEFTLKDHTTASVLQFENAITKCREAIECHGVNGQIDYVVKFIFRDIEHYQDVMNYLIDLNVGIDKVTTYIVTKNVKRFGEYPIDDLTQDLDARR